MVVMAEQTRVVMCKRCARGIEFTGSEIPEVHKECQTIYAE